MNRIYEIYIKETENFLWGFYGFLEVEDEKTDELVESYCFKKFGLKWDCKDGKMYQKWKYNLFCTVNKNMKILFDINDKYIAKIKRK